MPIELSIRWIVTLNCLGWPMIQMGLAWLFTRIPAEWLNAPADVAGEAWLYRHVLHVRVWKDRLPDAAGWFTGGFAKRSLASTEPQYLRVFIRETWRGELCHYCAFLFIPLFFLWNPWWARLVIIGYVILANAPCIIAQRYNRIRFRRLMRLADSRMQDPPADRERRTARRRDSR